MGRPHQLRQAVAVGNWGPCSAGWSLRELLGWAEVVRDFLRVFGAGSLVHSIISRNWDLRSRRGSSLICIFANPDLH